MLNYFWGRQSVYSSNNILLNLSWFKAIQMIYLSLLALFFYPALTVSGQITRMLVVAMCLICCNVKFYKKLEMPGILLLVWLAWSIICSYFGSNFSLSLFGYEKRWEGLSTMALVVAFGYFYWQCSNLNRLFALCGIILAAYLAIMFFEPVIYKNRVYGHISIAAFTTVITSMLIAKHPAFVFVATPFVFITQNRSMIIGIIFAFACLFLLTKKLPNSTSLRKWAYIGIATACLLAIPKIVKIDISTIGDGARSQFAKGAIDLITMRPLMGYGIDVQSLHFKPATGKMAEFSYKETKDNKIIVTPFKNDRSHNLMLDILFQTGFVGLIICLFIITRMTIITKDFMTEQNLACLCGVFGFLGFAMFNPTGIPAMFLTSTCIFGISKNQT